MIGHFYYSKSFARLLANRHRGDHTRMYVGHKRYTELVRDGKTPFWPDSILIATMEVPEHPFNHLLPDTTGLKAAQIITLEPG